MIEKDLTRIADALEEIVKLVRGGVAQVAQAAPVTTGTAKGLAAAKAKAAVVEAPQVVEAPVVAPTLAPNAPSNWPANAEELRLMAQKIAMKLGPQTLDFTAWVTKELKGYGVDTILTIPQDKIIDLAVKLDAYAREKGVNV